MRLTTEDWSFEGAQAKAKKILIHNRNAHLFKEGDRKFNFVIETELQTYQSIITEGLRIYLDNLVLDNGEEIRVLVFHCSERAYFEYFVEILNRIITESDNENFEARAREVVQIWIRFYQKPRKPQLTDSLILGLLGELNSIKDLLEQGLDKTLVLEAWTGPDQESKDFSFENSYLETKASKKADGHIHKINGIDQLDSHGKDLFLSSYHFSESSQGDCFTLNSLIEKLNLNEFCPVGLELDFYDKLYAYGYDRRDEISYEKYSYVLNSSKHFKVEDDFPSIVASSFIVPLPFNISGLTYNVDLNPVEEINFNLISREIS